MDTRFLPLTAFLPNGRRYIDPRLATPAAPPMPTARFNTGLAFRSIATAPYIRPAIVRPSAAL